MFSFWIGNGYKFVFVMNKEISFSFLPFLPLTEIVAICCQVNLAIFILGQEVPVKFGIFSRFWQLLFNYGSIIPFFSWLTVNKLRFGFG